MKLISSANTGSTHPLNGEWKWSSSPVRSIDDPLVAHQIKPTSETWASGQWFFSGPTLVNLVFNQRGPHYRRLSSRAVAPTPAKSSLTIVGSFQELDRPSPVNPRLPDWFAGGYCHTTIYRQKETRTGRVPVFLANCYMLKLDPQPQVVCAFGLRIAN